MIKETKIRLSSVLRNDSKRSKIAMDDYGWCDISELCRIQQFNRQDISEVVKEYEDLFSVDGNKIRINRGHNFKCKVGLKEANPPDVLYYVTGYKMASKIMKQGLKQSESFIRLDIDKKELKVKSPDNLVYIEVNAKQMKEDGIVFYQNNVPDIYLTDDIDKKYLKTV